MLNWALYLLENSDNKRTYLGVTNNLERRLKQHNGALKGGAKYTRNFKANGEWELRILVKDLSKNKALSLERTIKNKRKKGRGKTPLLRRLDIMKQIISENDLLITV